MFLFMLKYVLKNILIIDDIKKVFIVDSLQ